MDIFHKVQDNFLMFIENFVVIQDIFIFKSKTKLDYPKGQMVQKAEYPKGRMGK